MGKYTEIKKKILLHVKQMKMIILNIKLNSFILMNMMMMIWRKIS